MEYPIDFVVTWVNGNDPKWQQKNQCMMEKLILPRIV